MILADAYRVLFLLASAPAIGGVLLAAIGRVTGADWRAAMLPPIAMRLVVVGAGALGLAQLAAPAPPHLGVWMHPLMVGARAILFAGALAFVGARLAGGASTTFAAVTLALFAAMVTPIATDWLLGQVPGHAVSSIGMIAFVWQVAAATALVLLRGAGDAGFRTDMAKLMIAAALGLGYLAYMDYLILWFGNLPARVGFYAARDGIAGGMLVWSALVLGLALPVGVLATGRDARIAGAGVLAGLAAFAAWWIGGGIAGILVALAATAALVAVPVRRTRHG